MIFYIVAASFFSFLLLSFICIFDAAMFYCCFFLLFCFHFTPLGVWKWQYNSREGGARTMKDLKLKNPFNISMQLKRPQNILLLLHTNNKNVAATCEKWYCFQCYLSVAALEHQAATTIDEVVAKCLYPFFVNPCFY